MIDQIESYSEDINYDLYFGPAHPNLVTLVSN